MSMAKRRKFTVSLRQEIIEEFAARHGGQYDPALFFEEVRDQGRQHRAHDWFMWNRTDAAYQYNLWQARAFAQGVKVSFTVTNVGGGSFTMDAPMVISPLSGRKGGGGYTTMDPENEEHVAELSRQGAASLRSWIARYKFCLQHAEIPVAPFEQAAARLEEIGDDDDGEEAA